MDSTSNSTVEEEGVADEIGGVDTAYCCGDDDVECEFRAEDYECEETGADAGAADGKEGGRGTFTHLTSPHRIISTALKDLIKEK